MKNWLKVIVLILMVSPAFANDATGGGADEGSSVKPTFDSLGNTNRLINVAQSTRNPVLISSAPGSAFAQQTDTQALNIDTWRFREIVNMSTCAALALYTGGHQYATQTSSFGIVLSSDSAGLRAGDSWVVPSQDSVWGWWIPSAVLTCGDGGSGAGGSESYYSESKRR